MCSSASGSVWENTIARPVPTAPSNSEAMKLTTGLHFVLDLGLAHGMQQESGDDDALQAHRADDQQNGAETDDRRATARGKQPSSTP